MNVMQNMKKMRVISNENLLRPSLEQRARAPITFVEIFCIPHVQFTEKCTKSTFFYFGNKKMVMVTH